jgi:hypothetical protein
MKPQTKPQLPAHVLLMLFLSLFIAGCAHTQRSQGDWLTVSSVEPAPPAVLGLNERLVFTLRYSITNTHSMRIFARPYTGGFTTPGYSAHPSPLFPPGSGKAEGWFSFRKPATVDEVRLTMVDEETQQVVARASKSIVAEWR